MSRCHRTLSLDLSWHEPIAKAEEVMREMKVDAVSVVSEEKKLIGKVTRDAIEEERLKVEIGKPKTDLKELQQNPRREHDK